MAADKVIPKTAHLTAHQFDTVDFVNVRVQGKVEHNAPMRKIIILDVSGSMGDYAPQLVHNVFPSILSAEEEIDLILFSCGQTHHIVTAGQMDKVPFAQGGTNMSAVPGMVVDLIFKHQLVQIVIVTDGEVSDLQSVFTKALSLKATIPSSAIIRVLPIRFINSSYANPDTKAVMTVGMMATENVEPVDITGDSFHSIGLLAKEFFDSGASSAGAILRVSIPCLCRFPGDVPVKELRVRNNDHILLLSQGQPLDQPLEDMGIVIEDRSGVIPLTIERKKISEEDNIRQYLMLLNNRARINTTMSIDSRAIFDLVEKLTTFLTLSQEIKDGGKAVKPSTHLRLQQIKRRIDQSNKSLLSAIAQLRNMDAVSAFNSQQMASFLRQDDTSRASKALSMRQKKVYEEKEIDFESAAKKELKAFIGDIKKYGDVFSQEDLTASFYSMETMGDMCQVLVTLQMDDIDNMSLEEILLLVGSVGLPITANSRAVADPWIFRVDEVHMDCFLSQQDWCAARSLSKGKPLMTPGTQRPITGVVSYAVSAADDAMMRLYHKHFPGVSRMQSSVAMMGMVSDLPFCDVALQVSTLLAMSACINPGSCTSREFHTLKKLLQGIHTRTKNAKSFDELRANFAPEYFTGDLGITGILKPLLVWLENPTLELIPELVRLETRWRVKSRAKMLGVTGDTVLKDWLDLNSTYSQPLQPLFIPEPEDTRCYDQVCVDQIISQVKPWITWNPQSLRSLYELTRCTTVEDFNSVVPLPSVVSDKWMTYLAVETFHRPNIVDKDARVMTSPLLIHDEDIENYWKSIVRDHFTNEYRDAVLLKEKQEKIILRVRHLDELIAATGLTDFLTLLQAHCSPRDTDVLPVFLDKKCVNPLDKIWLFVTGSHPDSSNLQWNDGKVMRLTPVEKKKLHLFFHSTPKGEHMWMAFSDKLRAAREHVYRNGKTNRHGYCNDCPSYWALGYETPDEMRDAYSDEQWAEYLALCQNHNVIKEYLK